MSYSEETLRTKFDALEETQESIVNTSQWLLFHHRYHERTVNFWKEYLSTCDQKKKLPLLYIANEVIQQSRSKRRMGFVDSFAAILPESIKKCYDQVNDKIKEKLVKMVKVWRDRKIFSKDVEILGILCPGSTPSVRPSTANGNPSGPERTGSPAPQVNKTAESPSKSSHSVSSSSSCSVPFGSGNSSSSSTDVKVVPSIQKHKQTYEHLILETEGKLTKNHIPQLESLSSDLQEEISTLTDLLNKVQKEIQDINGTASDSKTDSDPLALLQSLQQPTAQTMASVDPLALLQSLTSSTALPTPETKSNVRYDDDDDDDEDGYEPESNHDSTTQPPQPFENAAELLRRIEELKNFSQFQTFQSPQPVQQEEESMPTYEEDCSDTDDEEILPETIIKELSPTISNPIVSKAESENYSINTKTVDGERPKKRLRFAL